MSGATRGPLVIYSGKVNGPAFIKIIEEVLPTFIENTFDSLNKQCGFMQNNAPPYRSVYLMKWHKNNHINVLKWPATSADLNPIGSLWDYIDKKLQKMKSKNIDELQQIIEDIWCGITLMHCQ